MAEEGVESIELSDAVIERVAGRVAELVAPRLSSQGPANPNGLTPEGEGGSSQGERYT